MGLLSALGRNGGRMLQRSWPQVANAASPIGESLTQRQMQILRLAGQGMPEEQIAQVLQVEPRMVRALMGRANQKMGVSPDYGGWSDGLLPPGMF